uniref:L antigen family member 3 n=1 Tax=Glossina morsitans morsitans TaxID=37546 RepID=A0A1D6UNL6_GLOMM
MPLDNEKVAKDTEATLIIPFASERHAEIAYRVLNVDQEPRRNFVQKDIRLIGDSIEVIFKAGQVKNIRTAINSFFEALLLCTDTIKEFDVAPDINAGTHASSNTP